MTDRQWEERIACASLRRLWPSRHCAGGQRAQIRRCVLRIRERRQPAQSQRAQ